MTDKEEEDLIVNWEPEPLVPEMTAADEAATKKERVVDGMVKTHVSINGQDKLNLTSYNFLGLVGDDEMQKASLAACHKYGIGSCGPRGFYGTVDVHLELEKSLASRKALLHNGPPP